MAARIIMFHGRDCPHCRNMMPLVEKLENEKRIKIEKLEVWHDELNANKMREYAEEIMPACGGSLGVPAFIKVESREALCGEQNYHNFKAWVIK